jgi:hypothetical protein
MTNKDFVNGKIKNKFHINYVLTKGEYYFALFSALILLSGNLFMLFHWMLQIATE